MTRDEIIKMARELDMIDFRDHDGDPHVAQFIDFLVTLVGKAEAATREECAALRGHPDVLAPVGNSAWGEAYQDGWIDGTAAYRDAIRAMNEKGTT